jgi:hypothetical protein
MKFGIVTNPWAAAALHAQACAYPGRTYCNTNHRRISIGSSVGVPSLPFAVILFGPACQQRLP